MTKLSYAPPKLKPVPLATKGKNFFKVLYLWLAVGRKWEISENWTYTMKDETILFVPQGFVFNGASIPRFFRFILSPTGLLLIPSIIHDYAFEHNHLLRLNQKGEPVKYRDQAGKDAWDQLFHKLSLEVHGIKFVAWVTKVALKIGGGIAWKQNNGTKEERKIAEVILKITGFLNVIVPFVMLGLMGAGLFFVLR